MTFRPVLAAAFTLGLTLPVQADISDMTAEERAAFRAEVRAYLLENPEVLMEAIAVLEEREASAGAERDMQLVARYAEDIFNAPHDFVTGNPEGDITIVEFLDYRCGFCRRAAPEVASLMANDGNIRLIIKEFPILGEQSTLASRFALSTRIVAGDEAYHAIHDALMAARSDMTEDSLSRLADELGYDGAAIVAGLDNPEIDIIISRNYALARAMDITGTPTFVIGNQLVRGFLPEDQMAAILEDIRADAN